MEELSSKEHQPKAMMIRRSDNHNTKEEATTSGNNQKKACPNYLRYAVNNSEQSLFMAEQKLLSSKKKTSTSSITSASSTMRRPSHGLDDDSTASSRSKNQKLPLHCPRYLRYAVNNSQQTLFVGAEEQKLSPLANSMARNSRTATSRAEAGAAVGAREDQPDDHGVLTAENSVMSFPTPDDDEPTPSQPGAFQEPGINTNRHSTGTYPSMATLNNSSSSIHNHIGPSSTSRLQQVQNEYDNNTNSSNRNAGLVRANLIPSSQQLSLSQLEVAEPVSAEEERHRRRHHHHHHNGDDNIQRKQVWFWIITPLVCFSVLVVVVTVVVALLVQQQHKDTTNNQAAATTSGSSTSGTSTAATTTAPTMMMDPLLFPLLPKSTQSIILDDLLVVQVSESSNGANKQEPSVQLQQQQQPQSMAYQWMLDDPNLFTYSQDRLLQRYALATFFFSTNGNTSWFQIGIKGGGVVQVPGESWFRQSALGPGGEGPPHHGGPPLHHGGPPQHGGDRPPPPPREEDGRPFRGGGGGEEEGPSGSYDPHEDRPDSPPSSFCPGFRCNVTVNQWLDYDSHECTWYSSAPMCLNNNNSDTVVLALALMGNGVGGVLPEELGLLTELRRIDLHTNRVGGRIPTSLSKLTKLWELELNSNQISGSVPPAVGDMTSLETLAFMDNELVGSIPQQVWRNLSNLQRFKTSQNSLTGTIPEDIGNWFPNLTDFYLGVNPMIHGTLPTSIGKCTAVTKLALHETQVNGTIPSELGLLSHLHILEGNGNRWDGKLPPQLGLLPVLGHLDLRDNVGLVGTIPKEWELLNNSLRVLDLQGTSISGTIPSGLCRVPFLLFDCGPLLCGCSSCNCSIL